MKLAAIIALLALASCGTGSTVGGVVGGTVGTVVGGAVDVVL